MEQLNNLPKVKQLLNGRIQDSTLGVWPHYFPYT